MGKKREYLDEPCLITDIRTTTGRHNQTIWDIKFRGLTTDREFNSWIDSTHVNYRKWRAVIDTHRANHPERGVVVDDLYFKDSQTNLVNADSQFAITCVQPLHKIESAVRQFRGEVNHFEDMFYKPKEKPDA